MHGLDLRDLRGVETFCAFIAERHEALDVLVNNACQTVRRPARYYATLVEGERRMSLTDGTSTSNIAVVSRDDAAKALAVVAPEDETVSFVAGKTDVNGQQLDLREHNSWTATLDEVATAEVVEAQAPLRRVLRDAAPHARELVVDRRARMQPGRRFRRRRSFQSFE